MIAVNNSTEIFLGPGECASFRILEKKPPGHVGQPKSFAPT